MHASIIWKIRPHTQYIHEMQVSLKETEVCLMKFLQLTEIDFYFSNFTFLHYVVGYLRFSFRNVI